MRIILHFSISKKCDFSGIFWFFAQGSLKIPQIHMLQRTFRISSERAIDKYKNYTKSITHIKFF